MKAIKETYKNLLTGNSPIYSEGFQELLVGVLINSDNYLTLWLGINRHFFRFMYREIFHGHFRRFYDPNIPVLSFR